MNSWKKLFQVKRVLALFLAVVLTVPTMPISSYAAPEDAVAAETVTVETVEETVSESEEVSVEASSVAEEEPVVEQGEETDVLEGESVVTPEETDVYAIEVKVKENARVKTYTGASVFDLTDSQYTDGICLRKNKENVGSAFDIEGFTYKW